MGRRSWIALASALTVSCTGPGYVKTAFYGDLPTLKREIAAASRAGTIDSDGVVELAEAVLRREVRSARGELAVDRVHAARACARAAETELREWAETQEDAGAEALLVLVDAGMASAAPLVDRYARAPNGAFRAVAARGTASPERAELRRSFYVDPDGRVRREALRAGAEAADGADLGPALEAARLDPEPGNRALAARLVGTMGGERAVIALLDLWARADEGDRMGILEAWAEPRAFGAGGARELLRVVESGGSLLAVAAAAELVRIGKDGAREAGAVLARSTREGTTDERLLAIQTVPLDEEGVRALDDATRSDDPPVKVVALARKLELPAQRGKAIESLREIARGNDAASRQARVALAAAGDKQAAPLLEKQLQDPDSVRRKEAALGLYRLGLGALMAGTLADSDPGVRMSVACSVASGRPSST